MASRAPSGEHVEREHRGHHEIRDVDQLADPEVDAHAADRVSGILVDVDAGRILWERTPYLSHAPASTTKLLSEAGYTGAAGPCLVATAVRGGHRLVQVLLGAPHLYADSRMLLDWGFTQEGLPALVSPPAAPASPAAVTPRRRSAVAPRP